jgi:hypothetical protein
VGYKELLETGLFRDPAAVVSFIRFYKGYDFCEPVRVYGFKCVGVQVSRFFDSYRVWGIGCDTLSCVRTYILHRMFHSCRIHDRGCHTRSCFVAFRV